MKAKLKLLLIFTLLVVGLLGVTACATNEDNEAAEQPPVAVGQTPLANQEPVQPEATVEEAAQPTEEPLAENQEPAASEEQPLTAEQTAATEQFPIRASELIGYDIKTMANEDLGKVDDIVIGLGNNADYAVISSDEGLLDLGPDTMLAIPLSALNHDAEAEAFTVNVDQTTLQNAPTFTEDNWANLNDPAWDDNFFDFWQNEQVTLLPETGTTAPATTTGPAFIRASEVMNNNVVSAADENLGQISDLILTSDPQRFDYAVLTLANATSGDNQLLVPMNHLNLSAMQDNSIQLDVDQAALQNAPHFNQQNFPDITTPDWDDAFFNFWNSGQ